MELHGATWLADRHERGARVYIERPSAIAGAWLALSQVPGDLHWLARAPDAPPLCCRGALPRCLTSLPPPPLSQVHAINERILDFGEALRRALPEGEAADIGRTSVAEVTQVSREASTQMDEKIGLFLAHHSIPHTPCTHHLRTRP